MLKLLNQFQLYIMGGLLALVLALSVGIYVKDQRGDRLEAERNAARVELSVSNASVDTLSVALRTVRQQLSDKQKSEQALQERLQVELHKQQEKDRNLTQLQDKLKANLGKGSKDCSVIDEDIKDAWEVLSSNR